MGAADFTAPNALEVRAVPDLAVVLIDVVPAALTVATTSGLTWSDPLTTRETVERDTPASAATASRVGAMRRVGVPGADRLTVMGEV